MRIGIITGCWQRHAVLQACLNNWTELGAVEIIAAYSPEDVKGGRILRDHGCRTVSAPNHLAEKFNAATRLASETTCDYFLHMGADDMVDGALWEAYNRFTGNHMALTDWYFHNVPTNETRYWPGYVGPRAGEPIGAGKLVSRDALEAIGWEPFINNRDNSLDFDQHHKLKAAGMDAECFRLRDIGGIGLDVKDAMNKTPWRKILPVSHYCNHLSETSPYLWANIKEL